VTERELFRQVADYGGGLPAAVASDMPASVCTAAAAAGFAQRVEA
jgi:hypothetical protein